DMVSPLRSSADRRSDRAQRSAAHSWSLLGSAFCQSSKALVVSEHCSIRRDSSGRTRPCPWFARRGGPGGSGMPMLLTRELLDPVVARVRDVKIPTRVSRHRSGIKELSVGRAGTPPSREEGPVRIELLDAAIVPIGNVDIPAR